MLKCDWQLTELRPSRTNMAMAVMNVVGECEKPATVRYREIGATYLWQGRCAEHEGALSREHCTVESL